MISKTKYLLLLAFLITFNNVKSQITTAATYNEPHRPKIHFSHETGWMNDPNGMVYLNGKYHLFYQYYPDSTVWGPMHWGHAVSKDLVHWEHLPVALYPDTLGYIFSGSAVVDVNNTSGFGKEGKAPLIAIFTHHDPKREKENRTDVETQSIAYSLDEGKTWTKYEGNPVIKNPGIRDFRDPKVMWYEPQKKWVMTLATTDHITFYSSPDLKNWTMESKFGNYLGAHGGVWECPDLFTLDDNGKQVWVLIVNLNPGGPNGGSATQYFLGNFDGKTFTPSGTATKWLDYGPDEYAGITWSNTGNRKIFLGWMSNWLYANVVPTDPWRSAMTVARELKLKRVNNDLLVTSQPVKELNAILSKPVTFQNVVAGKSLDLSKKTGKITLPCRLTFSTDKLTDYSVVLSNKQGEKVVIGYEKKKDQYYIDRTKSGKTGFQKDFPGRHVAPRFATTSQSNLTLIIDVSSVELFADDGVSVMTEIFFPSTPYDQIHIQSPAGIIIKKLEYAGLKSIWSK